MIIPILLYHHISDAFTNNITVTSASFRAQMDFLHAAGYHVIDVCTALGYLKNNAPVSPKTVLITFDDGYEDVYTNAYPILQYYNFTAALFPIVDAMGRWNEWNHRAPYIANHLTWAQLAELSRHGFNVGCHTLSHHSLLRFGPERVHAELQSAQQILAEKLSRPINTLSYPYGDHDSRIRTIAAELFDVAFTVDDGGWNWQITPFAMNRLTVRPGLSIDQFKDLLRRPFEPLTAGPLTDLPDIKT